MTQQELGRDECDIDCISIVGAGYDDFGSG